MNVRSHAATMTCVAALMLAGKAAHAADPTTADCLAASDASLQAGNDHKLREERSRLLVCAAASCPADIRKDCLGRVDEVNVQIPTILFVAKDASGADLSAVKVTMDGELLTERLEGTALSIDPGRHAFTFEAAGHPPLTRNLLVQEAQKERRESITFAGPTDGVGTLSPPKGAAQPLDAAVPSADSRPGLGTQRILALVAGGVGVVGLGLGTAFGVMALSQKNDARNACPGVCATQSATNEWSQATTSGNVSTVAFVVGGVALGGAAVLWFTAPTPGGASAHVGVGLGSLQVRGSW